MEDYKLVYLTQGKVAAVDTVDYDLVSRYSWAAHISNDNKRWYAITKLDDYSFIAMHKLLMPVPSGYEVDHKDHDGLNNRRSNLRQATHAQNNQNKGLTKKNKSGFIGVTWESTRECWVVQVQANGVLMYSGRFSDKKIAAIARDLAVHKIHGEFAVFNLLDLSRDNLEELQTMVNNNKFRKVK